MYIKHIRGNLKAISFLFYYKKHLYKKHEAEITNPVDC